MTDYKQLAKRIQASLVDQDANTLDMVIGANIDAIVRALNAMPTDTAPGKITVGSKVLVRGQKGTVTCLYHDAAGYECAVIQYTLTANRSELIDTLTLDS